MLVGGLTQQSTHGLQVLGDWLVGVKDVLPLVRSNHRVELTALVYRNVGWDACGLANVLVILTVGRCLVDNSGAIGIGNIVSNQDLPGVGDIK